MSFFTNNLLYTVNVYWVFLILTLLGGGRGSSETREDRDSVDLPLMNVFGDSWGDDEGDVSVSNNLPSLVLPEIKMYAKFIVTFNHLNPLTVVILSC